MSVVGTIRLAMNGRTDIGKVRDENEDNIQWSVHPKHPFGFTVIADGMGGYSGGALASSIAVNSIKQFMNEVIDQSFLNCELERQLSLLQTNLLNAVQHANQEIINAKLTRPDLAQMGTTIVVAVMWQQHLLVAHVGDSRAYKWDSQGLAPITKDHSLVQEMIDSGSLTPEEAKNSNIRNHITRALGVIADVQTQVGTYTLERNTTLMLCSDGLTEYLSDADIEYVLATHRPTLECCYRLVDEANRLGGKDNISVSIVEFSSAMAAQQLDVTNPPAERTARNTSDGDGDEDETIRQIYPPTSD